MKLSEKFDRNTIKSIKNHNFIPCPQRGAHNAGQLESFHWDMKGTWDFFGMDDYKSFTENLKTQPENWYYRHNKVRYTINSEGYRTKEFKDIEWENSIVMFGCSHVFGVGVDDEHTIPAFLEQMIGIPVINMGVGGSSIQLALHNSLMLYKKYGPPRMVIYGWTSLMRHLIYMNNSVKLKITNDDELNDNSAQHFIPFNLVNIQLIRNIWENKCPIYEFSTFNQTSQIVGCDLYYGIKNDYARDLAHPGWKTNLSYAEKIYKKIRL